MALIYDRFSIHTCQHLPKNHKDTFENDNFCGLSLGIAFTDVLKPSSQNQFLKHPKSRIVWSDLWNIICSYLTRYSLKAQNIFMANNRSIHQYRDSGHGILLVHKQRHTPY